MKAYVYHNAPCQHCELLEESHIDGQCLFHPTKYHRYPDTILVRAAQYAESAITAPEGSWDQLSFHDPETYLFYEGQSLRQRIPPARHKEFWIIAAYGLRDGRRWYNADLSWLKRKFTQADWHPLNNP